MIPEEKWTESFRRPPYRPLLPNSRQGEGGDIHPPHNKTGKALRLKHELPLFVHFVDLVDFTDSISFVIE